MSARYPTAMQQGLLGCHSCSLVIRQPQDPAAARHVRCPRCRSHLHSRKANSLARTWALLIAAAILYVPAMVYPVTVTSALGQTSNDTILDGVEYLYNSGDAPIAIVLFCASIVVPCAKLLVMAYLLISVQLRSAWRPKDRTVMYRMTEFIGRWSMLDVFVVTLLVALVRVGALATIEPGLGVGAFASVVVLTMFAAMSFDPRLIWDHATPGTEARSATPALQVTPAMPPT